MLRDENPDIIHLHNIHGYYLNYKVLFKYLKNEYSGKIYWTFHDCWPFTGHCPYFTAVNCNKWKTQCYKCPNKKKYPTSLVFDNSKNNYLEKKELFTGLNNLTIITPSDWLNNLVKQSFLKDYEVITINNTIDTNIFKPTKDENILNRYNIPDNKKILLGVASVWEQRKGLEDFIKLSKKISNDYIIVLVGLTKKQIKKLKQYFNISGIERTENQIDLAKLYTVADYFLNLTYEDNYPTVNLEAMACGTKVISYDTGGCREQIKENNGIIVSVGDLDKVLEVIKKECSK
jgi:glycosyltransferase involved in cell wall biosynthesis